MNNILIVGAGPVGLLLAISLSQYDINVKIIDKIEPARDKFSKALTINAASLKSFHGLGIVEDFLNNGKKITKADIFFNKKRMMGVNKKYIDSLYNFYLSVPQFEIEKILENKLRRLHQNIDYNKELLEIENNDEKVQVTIKDLETQQIRKEFFDFVIGCDGAHSSVRKLLKLPFDGKDYNFHLLIADVCFSESPSFSKATYYLNDDGFIGLFPMNNGFTRIVIQKKGPLVNLIAPAIEDIQLYLELYLPHKLSINALSWSSCARVVSRITSSNNINKIFLAGDAWHLFSSVGGQTMNTGIQDAFDLGWVLGHYLKHHANENLLNKYAQDRMVAVKKIFDLTDMYTKLITGELPKDERLKFFLPDFSNRKYYKETLSCDFSGYKADYSQGINSIIGRHVPYVEFQEAYPKFNSTYDLPKLKKNILFALVLHEKNSLLELLSQYHSILELITVTEKEVKLLKSLELSTFHVCLLSPGGYIIAHGTLEHVVAYLKKYYDI